MANFQRVSTILMISAGSLALAACGADDIASPGTGGNVTITNNTTNVTPPPPPPPASTLVVAATGCPTIGNPVQLSDDGTITGPTGTYRVCTLPAVLTASSTLTRVPGLLYRLGGRVDVGVDQGPTEEGPTAAVPDAADVVITIQPGVVVFGGTGVSWLNVNRGNRISAIGNATNPIVFTSRDNILGLSTDASIGQWGGVVLSGRAPVTDCAAPAATPGTIACERQVEGAVAPALYGGATANDNSGRMSYVQIRYSGFVLSGNSELQALTTGGTGSATVFDHIQSFNSSDDGAEFFGGSVNMKYFAAIGADDDALDTDVGLKGNFQYVLAVQRNGAGDSMIEADSDNTSDGNIPRQNTRLSNFTFIQRANIGNQTAILLRGGTDYSLVNGVIASPDTTCFRISRTQTASATVDAAIDEAGVPLVRSVVGQCLAARPVAGTFVTTAPSSNDVFDAQVVTIFGSGSNNNNSAFTPTLTSLYINGTAETAITPFNAATLNVGTSTFFDTTTFIGAVQSATDTAFRSWTCNSVTADFGTGNSGLCSSLPTI
jgi:hypothetical protein